MPDEPSDPSDLTVVVWDPDIKKRSENDLTETFEQDFIDTKIEDTVAFIVDRVPGVAARLTAGTLSRNNYLRVVADCVLRVLRNPGGKSSEGEGGYSYSTSSVVASGNMWLTADDLRTLQGLTSPLMFGTLSMDVDDGWARAAP